MTKMFEFRQKAVLLSLFAAHLFLSCSTTIPEKGTGNYDEALKSFYVGLAAVQVGNDQRAAVELKKASELAAGEPAVWNNLGVLQLRQKDFEKASESFAKARGLAPEDPLVYFNLALLAQQQSDGESFKKNLEKVRELNAADLRPLYLVAVENEKQKKDNEALAAFEEILKSQPKNIAALIETARLRAKGGDRKGVSEIISNLEEDSGKWPQEAVKQLTLLKETPVEDQPTQIAFLRNVLLRLPVFRASIDKIKPSDTVVGDLMLVPLKLDVPDLKTADPDLELTFKSASFGENETNGVRFVFLDGESVVTAVSTGNETIIGDVALPVSFGNPDQIAVLDFDYDYRNDIAFAGPGGFKLFRQEKEDYRFEDVTSKMNLPDSISTGAYAGVWPLDFDNEGDLDLLLAPTDSPPFVLRNRGNGTFEKLNPNFGTNVTADFEYADLDEDGDSDAVLLRKGGNVDIFENMRGGLFRHIDEPHLENIVAIAVGDSDRDGMLDLITLHKDGALDSINIPAVGNGLNVNTGFSDCVRKCTLISGDFDNNGANDIVVSNGKSSKIFLVIEDNKAVELKNALGASAADLADLNSDGKLDLIGVDSAGKPVKLTNESTKDYGWQIVKPKSVKSEGDQRINTFGIGGEIETRSGLAVHKQLIRTPQVHFGLGNSKQADVIRVVWQNGYVQAEFDIKANQVVAAEQRLKGSCPHLFAWNGQEFAHVKDAPPWSPALGLKINAQDTYGILQTEEWFKIPGEALKPKDDKYELRITGEYWEAYYLDHYRLMVVDHPVETEVFTDERFAIPLPPLKVFTTEKTHLFKSAVDHNGKDVFEVVSKIDEKYLDDIKRGKYQGVAEDHYVELELPDDAPLDKKLWVVADGWVHPTDASINVQRGQDVPRPPRSLSIETQDENGQWKTAKENLGFPAGKMKTVLLDLEGVFSKESKSRKLRLRTEMEVFWDKLAWAVDVEGASNVVKELDIESAELRYRGFSVIDKPDDSSPEVPDYSKIMTTEQRWRDLEGYYTRFGDIKALLTKTDDRFVLANAGDEVVLKFPAMPPVKDGFKRDFVIIGNGWIKDGDLNSVFSRTVLPLPTQASNDYTKPPTTLEADPVYQKNKQDWVDFHTRYVAPDRFRNALRQN